MHEDMMSTEVELLPPLLLLCEFLFSTGLVEATTCTQSSVHVMCVVAIGLFFLGGGGGVFGQ